MSCQEMPESRSEFMVCLPERLLSRFHTGERGMQEEILWRQPGPPAKGIKPIFPCSKVAGEHYLNLLSRDISFK